MAALLNDTSTSTPVDGLSLWEAETPSVQTPLSLIRLDGNERLLVPFTVAMARAEVHYLDAGSLRGYVRCNGSDCILCRAGLQKDVRDLWPVYDLVARSVGVIAITSNMRPFALRPQLLPILRQVKNGTQTLLLTIRYNCEKYTVSSTPLPEGVDDGAAAIARFQDQLTSNQIDMASVYPRYANEELASIPEIAARLSAKGIKVG